MTKEDYMCLPKARLAEMLAERDERDAKQITYIPYYPNLPVYYDHPRIIQEYTTTGKVINKEDSV